ncbi:DUF2017 domain-containing protein [Pseudonocardiaceae bacterium YIM PH 21723]|nr:DUF2017 domain-containing protein [Pseudonocardiaceae bacterium YIM PH 21723]
MKAWSRDGQNIVTELTQHEAQMVRFMVDQIKELLTMRFRDHPQDELSELTGIRTGPSSKPEDPMLARLLPDFHHDPDYELAGRDADSAAALRSMHEPALLEAKSEVADVVLKTCPEFGGRITLTPEEAQSWLYALNDVRLALGTALEISEDFPDELPEDDPRAGQLDVYQWLTWMQDSLVGALTA